jgi:hypothetical protein
LISRLPHGCRTTLGLGPDELAAHLDSAIARIKVSMSKSLGAFAEIGRELKHINENELFLARYPTFMEFVHAELGISWQKAYWFIRVHHRLEQLKAQLPGVEDLPSEEGHMRLLDKVPDELLGAQWERVVSLHQPEKLYSKQARYAF